MFITILIRFGLLLSSLIAADAGQKTSASNLLLHAALTKTLQSAGLKMALRLGANVNFQFDEMDGMTALMLVCQEAETEASLDILLSCPDININLQDSYGNTALHFACKQSGSLMAVERLLATGACELNNVEAKRGNTPLHLAAANGKLDIVRRLIGEPGVELNKRNAFGNTALHVGVLSRSLQVVSALLEAGLNALEKNEEGLIPLDLAINLDDEALTLEIILHLSNGNQEELLEVLYRSCERAHEGGHPAMAMLVKHQISDIILAHLKSAQNK